MAEVVTPPAAEGVPVSVPESPEELAQVAAEGRFETTGRKGHRTNLKQLHNKPNYERNVEHDREMERKEVMAAIVAGTKWPAAMKPDEAAFQGARQKLSQEISRKMGELGHLNEKINSVGGQKEYIRKIEEIRAELETWETKSKELLAKKQKCHDRLNESLEEMHSRKRESKKILKNIGFSSPEALEEEIRNLENKTMTCTLSLKDEKTIINKIEYLHRSKSDMEVALSLAKPSGAEEAVTGGSLKEELGKVTQDVSGIMEKIKSLRKERDGIVAARKAIIAPLKEFYESKTICGAKLSELRDERSVLEKEYYKKVKHYRMFELYQKMAHSEKRKEERARMGLQQKLKSMEENLNNLEIYPEEGEINLLHQAVSYLQNLINERDNIVPAAPVVANSESESVPPPKNKREEQYYIKPQKNFGKQKHHTAVHAKTSPSDLATVGVFSKFGIMFPIKTTEYERCIEILDDHKVKLDQKKNKYMDTVGDRRREVETEIAQLNELINSDDTQKIITVGLAELDKNKANAERQEE